MKLKLDSHGSTKLPTLVGALFKIFSLLLMTVYATYQFNIFFQRTGSETMLSVEENYFAGNEVFGRD